MQTSDPSPELVSQAQQGDVAAFEQLIERYQRAVFNIALYKSKNYFDAEDLSQDIFLAAFQAIGTLKSPEKFAGWLFGIAYNRCHKWFRRERNKVVKMQELRRRAAEDAKARHAPPRSSSTGHDPADHLSEVLRKLPDEIRETLTLKYLDGLSYEEIEERLHVNSNRIDYLIRKGKDMIRERMARAAGEHAG